MIKVCSCCTSCRCKFPNIFITRLSNIKHQIVRVRLDLHLILCQSTKKGWQIKCIRSFIITSPKFNAVTICVTVTFVYQPKTLKFTKNLTWTCHRRRYDYVRRQPTIINNAQLKNLKEMKPRRKQFHLSNG